MNDVAVRAAAAGAGTATRPPVYKAVGITLAVCSGLFIGSSFVLKKKGLLKANTKYSQKAGEGYGYLKNAWWWTGMILMIIGEICNFVAYSFTDAILVTPLGALSVVITTILSAIFLKERLSFVGKVGCFNCIIGSVIIVLSSPEQSAAANIQQMQAYVIAPGFLTYAGIIIVGCTCIALWAGPRYGKKSMLVYLSICSLVGGLSVVATQGLGAAIVTQISGTAQFNHWFIYILLAFVICTLSVEIVYLNKALNLFNAALVTPTYYVYFTSSTIVTSAILFRGFKGTPQQIIMIVMGFLQICSGVVLLQLSKSAKDVPDTAIFTGDLDQVRTIAEQEAPESDPKADAIRGGAVLLRSLSKSRMRKEADEAKRLQEELLHPIGEHEAVEWDGLRRRRTVLAPGQAPLGRSKSVHPPLGMTHFPSDTDTGEADAFDDAADDGLFSNLRKRAYTVWHPGRSHSVGASGGERSTSGVSYTSIEAQHHGAPQTLPLDSVPSRPPKKPFFHHAVVRTNSATASEASSGDLAERRGAGAFGSMPRSESPSSLHSQDSAYRSYQRQAAAIHFAAQPAVVGTGGPPAPPALPHDPRRQFSFQNIFHRHGRDRAPTTASTYSGTAADDHQSGGWRRRGNSGAVLPRGRHVVLPTEEERLGLVKGEAIEGALIEKEEADLETESDDGSLDGKRNVIRVPKARRRHDGGNDGHDSDEKGADAGLGYQGRRAFL